MVIRNKVLFQNVMVIDESELDRVVVKKMLTIKKFAQKISLQASAKDALSYFVHEPFSNYPQLILLDIYMPQIDGFAFLDMLNNAMQEKIQNIPVIMLTSSIDPADVNKAKLYANIILYVNKPVDSAKIEKMRSFFEDDKKNTTDLPVFA